MATIAEIARIRSSRSLVNSWRLQQMVLEIAEGVYEERFLLANILIKACNNEEVK